MLKTSLSLQTSLGLLPDIQIWADPAAPFPSLGARIDHVSAVDYQKIPLFLVTCGPYDVYSKENETETYFYENVVNQGSKTGVMAKPNTENEKYIVFFSHSRDSQKVQCFVIDFAMLESESGFAEKAKLFSDKDVFFESNLLRNGIRSDTSIFDRFLDKKSLKKSSANATPQPQVLSSTFTKSAQISQAVNRVILSELRLRNLSGNKQSSAKDKIVVREIYHMTKKAALFALRKHGYEFNRDVNSSEGKINGVSLNDIHGIVESLLSIFVDVDSSSLREGSIMKGPF